MTKQITNVAGIIDPVSLSELRLSVTSSQTTKSFVLLYNIIESLVERVFELESHIKETENVKAVSKTVATRKTEPAKEVTPKA